MNDEELMNWFKEKKGLLRVRWRILDRGEIAESSFVVNGMILEYSDLVGIEQRETTLGNLGIQKWSKWKEVPIKVDIEYEEWIGGNNEP